MTNTKPQHTPGPLEIAREMDAVHACLTRAVSCEDGSSRVEIEAALDYIYGFVGALKAKAPLWEAASDLLEAVRVAQNNYHAEGPCTEKYRCIYCKALSKAGVAI